MKHNKRTKAEQEYVSAMIQNLSLQRLTDQEIVDYLHNEKQIEIARSTVTNIRNRVERKASKWYQDLRASTTKYIAAYKERLDSLFKYQNKLHQIIDSTKKDEVKIRAICELHSIEMDIFNLWKQLPDLDIIDSGQRQQEHQPQQEEYRMPLMVDKEDSDGVETIPEPESSWNDWVQCHGCQRYWRNQELLDYHQKKNAHTYCNKENSIF
jgi:hypothetical protein